MGLVDALLQKSSLLELFDFRRDGFQALTGVDDLEALST
jgi:hypothetical protein